MPGVPIEIPSEIVMVLKITGLPPAAATPSAARRASRSMCRLHGVTWLHVEAMPTCDFRKSAHVNPTACNIARLAARSIPSVTACDHFRCNDPFCRAFMRTPRVRVEMESYSAPAATATAPGLNFCAPSATILRK